MIDNNDACESSIVCVDEKINVAELVRDMSSYRDWIRTLISGTDCPRVRTILQAKCAEINNILTPLSVMLQASGEVDGVAETCIVGLRDRFLDLVSSERNVGKHESYIEERYEELGLSYDRN